MSNVIGVLTVKSPNFQRESTVTCTVNRLRGLSFSSE